MKASILPLIKKSSLLIIFIIVNLLQIQLANAAWVEKMPTTITNPDGSKIECYVSGDEFFNYLHDADGYTIIAGEDGFYYYAQKADGELMASAYRVGQISAGQKSMVLEPGIGISKEEYQRRKEEMFKGLDLEKSGSKASHEGVLNNIVIYIRFNDDEEFNNPRSLYDERLNLESGPSVRNYFNEVSYGMVDVISSHYPHPSSSMDINISFQDIYPRSYFEPYHSVNNPNGYTSSERARREHELLDRAVNAVESQIPEDLVIDSDNDGRVDNVTFIIKGGNGAWASILWAHRWMLYTTQTFIHGKRVWDYTFQPESQATIQILSHEIFHTFGAPDLYRYSHTGIVPVGPWDLMHSGRGHMSAYMKYKYSNQTWINEIPVITEPGTYTLNPLTSPDNNAFKIPSPNSDTEYFVVEYRKKVPGTYEGHLPGSGLLVYRINSLVSYGNMQGPPDEVYLFRLNGTNSLNGLIHSAHFSADVNRTEISDYSNPSAFLTDGSMGGLLITNISEAGESISFDLYGISSEVHQINVQANPSFGGQVTGSGTYTDGQQVTVTAQANDNFGFEAWVMDGTVVSINSIYTFTAGASKELMAQFTAEIPIYDISAQANPLQGGEISGAGHYFEGDSVHIEVQTAPAYNFEGWFENDTLFSTNESLAFTAERSKSMEALFSPKTLSVELSVTPENAANLTGAGTFSYGAYRAVNAFAREGYEFVAWKENGEVIFTHSQYVFQLTENRNLVAVMQSINGEEEDEEELVYCNIVAGISPINSGITEGYGVYESGTQVEVTAIANEGFVFESWTEADSLISLEAQISFVAEGDRELTANFTPKTYQINISVNPSDAGTISGTGTYQHGETVSVETISQEGFAFDGWFEANNLISSDSVFTFIALEDKELIAQYSIRTHAIALAATPAEGGEVSGAGVYNHAEAITIEAQAALGYTFNGWYEAQELVSANPVHQLSVMNNRTLEAHFAKDSFALSVSAIPADAAQISGSGTYEFGDSLSILAHYHPAFTLDGWFENGELLSTQDTLHIVMNTNRSIVAHFTINSYTLDLTAQPDSAAILSGSGSYQHGQMVVAMAVPSEGYEFVAWEENGATVYNHAEYVFEMTENRSLVAKLQAIEEEIVFYNVVSHISPLNAGYTEGYGTYETGSQVELNAIAHEGFIFENWTEGDSIISMEAQFSFIIEGNRALAANFTPKTYQILVSASPAEAGTVTGSGEYQFAETAVVEAQAAAGYIFNGWYSEGELVSLQEVYEFTVESTEELIAEFEVENFIVNVSASPSQGGFVSGAGMYPYGSTVAVLATPNSNYTFTGWFENGILLSTNAEINFTVSRNHNLSARFVAHLDDIDWVKVSLSTNIKDVAKLKGAGYYKKGERVRAQAVVIDSNYEFVGWYLGKILVSRWTAFTFRPYRDLELTAVYRPKNETADRITDTKNNTQTRPEDGLNGNDIMANIHVYPNPSKGKVNIAGIPTDATIEVINTSGAIVFTEERVREFQSLDLHHLTPGLYFINITKGSARDTQRLIIK